MEDWVPLYCVTGVGLRALYSIPCTCNRLVYSSPMLSMMLKRKQNKRK